MCDWSSRRAAEGACAHRQCRQKQAPRASREQQAGFLCSRRNLHCLCSELEQRSPASLGTNQPCDVHPGKLEGWGTKGTPGSAPAATSLLDTGPSDAHTGGDSTAESARTPQHSDQTAVVPVGHGHPTALGCSLFQDCREHSSPGVTASDCPHGFSGSCNGGYHGFPRCRVNVRQHQSSVRSG